MSMISRQVAELREWSEHENLVEEDRMMADLLFKAADTIEMLSEKARGQEWIPCEERLPSEKERVESYIRDKKASEFIVMLKEASRPTTLYLSWDNYWFDENRIFYEVIAWMPLPESYIKGVGDE